MLNVAKYSILEIAEDYILIQDEGPWDQYPTITNSAENVLQQLREELKERRLIYLDSEGFESEILHNNGVFKGFSFYSLGKD